ncbi:MAG: hypothetical protein AABZ28_05345 [Nitrospinota bacterium]
MQEVSIRSANRSFLLPMIIVALLFFKPAISWAAVGCTLNDPDRDTRRLFPESTGYKTTFITILEKGGEILARKLEEKLNDSFEPVYETLDVPYAYYQIFKGKEHIGWVFGVNQKGEYGGLQLILATDLKGEVLNFYYQRISSPDAKRFRDKGFLGFFKGLTLRDFEAYDPKTGKINNPASSLVRIKNPIERNDIDFKATLRGLKKNLTLFNEFWKEGTQ